MKKLIYLILFVTSVAALQGCSDDSFPVPPASTVAKFSRTMDNDEFAPATVTFINQSIIPARAGTVSYAWSFGDGTSSTQQNPSHLYTEPGAYQVTLVIVTNGSFEITEYKQSIVIKDPNASGIPFIFWAGGLKSTLLNDREPIVSELTTPGASGVYGTVVDTVNNKIYIGDNSTKKIYVANLDGTDFKDFRSGAGSVNGIALDYHTGKLYWGTDEGTIQRANLTDATLSQFETVVTGQTTRPQGLAIDNTTRTLFWNNYNGGLWKMNIDTPGSESQLIANPGGGGSIVVINNRIFYDEYTATNDIKIRAANFDGTNDVVIVTGISRLLFACLVYDKENQKILWGDRNAFTIKRADLDGSNVENVFVSTSTATYPRAFALGKKK